MNLLKITWALVKPYWSSSERYKAFGLLGLNILCVIFEIYARVNINDFSKDFYDALQRVDQQALTVALSHFFVAMSILVITVSYSLYLSGVLSIHWRKWLTRYYLHKWLLLRTHRQLTEIDNPDQRIAEDLEKFATSSITLFFLVFHSCLFVCVFGKILWDLSGQLDFFIPGYLFWCAFLYPLLGSIIITWLGKKLVKLNYQQQVFNANFRYKLVKVRDDANRQINFKDLFDPIVTNFLSITQVKKNLAFFNNTYNTISFVVGITIAIPFYLHKKIQLGILMQISGAFSNVVNAFSVFVNSFAEFAEWRAVTRRLLEFENAMMGCVTSQTAEPVLQ